MTIKQRLHQIVFGTDTRAGRLFDVILLWMILGSVIVVMLESIPELGASFHIVFYVIELILTVLFSIEYLIRIWISPRPIKYVISFWGIIDLLSILPTIISFFFIGYQYLLVVRIFRLLRVFRILKLVRFNSAAKALVSALQASSYKISIFLLSMVMIATLLGTVMYVVEGGEKGFTSIPQSIYWAIVTVTTVGYGDLVPQTILGKFISSFTMIIGYAIIAVPTGIVSIEMAKGEIKTKECDACHHGNHLENNFCSKCGSSLKST